MTVRRDMVNLSLSLSESQIPRVLSLFSRGVGLPLEKPCSVYEFLAGQPGFSASYLEKRIQTVFLNGRVVDDLHQARLHDGDTLALSAAMPGAVGAFLRKGGYYARLRRAISAGGPPSPDIAGGQVELKLFNFPAREVGPALLAKGVEVPGGRMAEFLAELDAGFWRRVPGVSVNGVTLSPEELLQLSWQDKRVLLEVQSV